MTVNGRKGFGIKRLVFRGSLILFACLLMFGSLANSPAGASTQNTRNAQGQFGAPLHASNAPRAEKPTAKAQPNAIEQGATPTAGATEAATQTPVDGETPLAAGTALATETPTPAPTDTLTAEPTETPTPAPTETETPIVSATATQAPTDIPTEPVTETPTPVATETVTPPTETMTPDTTETAVATETVPVTVTPEPTETETVTATDTPTATETITPTVTVTPVPDYSLDLAIAPDELAIAPGKTAAYSVVITNTGSVTTTFALSAENSDEKNFASEFETTEFSLAPNQAGTTILNVSADPTAAAEAENQTTVRASADHFDYASATVTTRILTVEFNRALSGPGTSAHYAAPNTNTEIQIGVRAAKSQHAAILTDTLPRTWQVLDAGDATVKVIDDDTQKLEWRVGGLDAGAVLTKTYTVLSPAQESEIPDLFQTTLKQNSAKISAEPWSITVRHPLARTHFRFGWNLPLDKMRFIAHTDEPANAIPRYQPFRVRFQILNAQNEPVRWVPRLEWSDAPDGIFKTVAAQLPVNGEPFYTRVVGTVYDDATLPTDDFGTTWDNDHLPQRGVIFTLQNPAHELTLAPNSFTEVEFSVRGTKDAAYLGTYYFRLSDDDRVLSGDAAPLVLAPQPELQLSEPQYSGIKPDGTKKLRRLAELAESGSAADPVHVRSSLTGAMCTDCHRSHTAVNKNVSPTNGAQSALCFTCHDGSNTKNIAAQYSDSNVPANDVASGAFYAHQATVATSHTAAQYDEFGETINRHSECGDCHNSHNADSSPAAQTANGYTVSGAEKEISGVGVSGAARTLTWKSSATYEYELCYKCHSSYTGLLSYPEPSGGITDVAAEFNPANGSFHPIEAVGTNNSITMTLSLAGTSPYKLWNFGPTDLVRCVNCHGDYRLANPSNPPMAGARLAPHTSKNRGVLMNNYRDRVLKSQNDPYAKNDFALCYQCHAEAPFVDISGSPLPETNFSQHGFHVSNIANNPAGNLQTGTSIDAASDGQGNALCAECHFRTHGQGATTGNSAGSRLVNFAPNVQPNSVNILEWDPNARTCSLSCHGADHKAAGY